MVFLAVAFGFFAAEPIPKEITIEAGGLQRFIQLQPSFRTRRIVNKTTGESLEFAADTPEFIVETTDGVRWTTDDFTVKSMDSRRVVLRHRSNERISIIVEPPNHSSKTLGRRLILEGCPQIKRLAVEAMRIRTHSELGGLGIPLLLDDRWWIGLEHPAGVNTFDAESGCIQLWQYPSKNESMKAVVGGVDSTDDRLEDAFERYIDSIRRAPPRPLLQYNTWFDLRGADFNPKSALKASQEINDRLLKPYDLTLHSFVLDDGWQDPKTLWQPQGEWKKGLPDFAAELNRQRAHLGLWLPLNGASLDVSQGFAKGYFKTNYRKDCYCLDSPAYRAALIARFAELQKTGVSFYKHDFNYLTCSADGHGHLPTKEHGREANVEGQLAVLDAVKTTSAVTSNAWPSPYWLQHTDFLWIGSFDYSEDWSVPCWSKRQAEMTFRDGVIHRLLRIDRTPIPMNALMTHGLIRGRHEGATADRDLNDWADYVMMFLGRGVMLQELYITPELLGENEWRILGMALRWADSRSVVLKHTRMIGGRPDLGEPYGYIHWGPEMGIVCLRNPSPRPATIAISTLERPRDLPSHSSWTTIQIYPDRRRLSNLIPARPLQVSLSGHEVAIIEFEHDEFLKYFESRVPLGRMETSRGQHGVGRIDAVDDSKSSLSVLRNDPDRLDWKIEWQADADERQELIWWTHPSKGATSSFSAETVVDSPSDVSPPAWSIQQRAISPAAAHQEFWLKLPWSPIWPQETRASAVIRTTRKPTEVRKISLPFRTERFPELRPSHQGAIIEEALVLDGWRFHRRRSLPEKLGWVLALGVAPVGLIGTAGRGLGRKAGRPKLLGLIAALLLVAIYAFTPLGAAMGRLLGEF